MNVENSYRNTTVSAYREVFEQFASDAAFLWILRSVAVHQPHYKREDIGQLEQRIDAHLDGLMTGIEESWPICVEALSFNEPGETFVATVLAFRSHDVDKIQAAVEAGLGSDDTARGFISALGWLPLNLARGWIGKLIGSKDLGHKFLAIGGCSVRREDPGDILNRILQRDDCRQHDRLYARSLRLVGELGRADLAPYLREAMQTQQEDAVFWASWSAILLGDHDAASSLKAYVFEIGPGQMRAIDMAFRVLPVEQARRWISSLSGNPTQARAVIRATGALADPHAVNWLLAKMEEPVLARLAGEAFTNITGIDLEHNQLVLENPLTSPPQPNDDSEDDDVSLDEDENLPWPDPAKIKSIWANHGSNFVAGQRYFMGRGITPEILRDKLENSNQRQRHSAAMELALISPDQPLSNTSAKVAR